MLPNYYDRERLAQTHHQDLLREAEQQRLVAHLLRRRSLSKRVVHDLGLFLMKLGMSTRAEVAAWAVRSGLAHDPSSRPG